MRKIDACANKKNGICSVNGGQANCSECETYSSKLLSTVLGYLRLSPVIVSYRGCAMEEMLEDQDDEIYDDAVKV